MTLVITDVDDMIPTFNRDNFTVAVPEDVIQDTPLPDLNLIVSDGDISSNAAYELVLESLGNAEGIFSVYPETAVGRTPVIIRVVDPTRLDHELEDSRAFQLVVKAIKGSSKEVLSSARVTVVVRDSNDNVPVFQQDSYSFVLREDIQSGESIGKIIASDADSGSFGQVVYALRGQCDSSNFDSSCKNKRKLRMNVSGTRVQKNPLTYWLVSAYLNYDL